jgi:uncharacterized delta-60 repeat protein
VIGGASGDFAVARYLADGTLDTSFSGDGKQTINFGSSDFARGVRLQSDGKILLAGHVGPAGSYDIALARLNADGSLDTTFDGDGMVTTPIGTAEDVSSSLEIQPDGKIIVTGHSFNAATNDDFAVLRYNSDGTLDETFGTGGVVTTAIGPGHDVILAVALQADGRIVVSGRTETGGANDFALARYHSIDLPQLPGDYNLDGSVDGADYVMWMKLAGSTSVPPYSSANGNSDTVIDDADRGVWVANFGEGSGGAGGDVVGATSEESEAIVMLSNVVAADESNSTSGVSETESAARRLALVDFDDPRVSTGGQARAKRTESITESALALRWRDAALAEYLASHMRRCESDSFDEPFAERDEPANGDLDDRATEQLVANDANFVWQ